MEKLRLKSVITYEDKKIFIEEIQEAFQKSYEAEFGKWDKPIIPEADIIESFEGEGAEIYFATINEERVGGAVISVDTETNKNSLDLLYVRLGVQNSGNGLKIWKAIEQLHPETKVWETHTPYFDTRNIHFYVNRCGFKIVEFFNSKHKDPNKKDRLGESAQGDNGDFFRFEKTNSAVTEDVIEDNYIADNKSFMYYLHEENSFEINKLQDLCNYINTKEILNKEELLKLLFIQNQILRHIVYHFDNNDVFFIKNLPEDYQIYIDKLEETLKNINRQLSNIV